jgi:hypothetical protein
VLSSNAWQRKPAPAGQPTREEIEHGRYLVEEVAKCAECHTPRKANGELDEQARLQGAPIWIRPVANIQPWADHAPALAGLPSFTDEQTERVLERGTGPNGEPLRAPMHNLSPDPGRRESDCCVPEVLADSHALGPGRRPPSRVTQGFARLPTRGNAKLDRSCSFPLPASFPQGTATPWCGAGYLFLTVGALSDG